MKKLVSIILCIVLLGACLLLPATAALDAASRNLLNASPLTPLYTGFSPLDQMITNIFNSKFGAGMSTYDKVKICYDYVNTGASYSGVTPAASTYNAIRSECGYYKNEDMYLVARAYHFLKDKRGSCIDFADAFMVLARAIGLECYIMHGTYDSGQHYWNLVKLSGDYYIFDAEADWRSAGSSWSNPKYNSFCLKQSADTHRSCNRSSCIAEFGNFQCKNKTNNAGATVPGSSVSTPVASAYTPGVYRTYEAMNFRADHNTSASIYLLIPSGTTLTVTEIYENWGKISYNGKTGWISLDWSTKVSDVNTTVPAVTVPNITTPQVTTPQVKTTQGNVQQTIQQPQISNSAPISQNVTYALGAYTTLENMNFRSEPREGSSIYCVIPAGTTLIVTEVSGAWGKTTYLGVTGWMLLQYSAHNDAAHVFYAIAGDIDGDGVVTAEDARVILRHSVSLEFLYKDSLIRADVDGDGDITSEDARMALRKSVHLE